MKLHVGLNHGTMIPEFVVVSDGREGDLAQGQRFDLPKGSSVACDKGYVNYGWYKSLTDKGVFFVTRLKTTSIDESWKALAPRRRARDSHASIAE